MDKKVVSEMVLPFLFDTSKGIVMIETHNIADNIIAGTKEVFSTMLMTELASGTVLANKKCEVDSNLTSMIGLGGDIRGVLAIHTPAKVAMAITGGFLGIDIASIDEDVKDAIGEIANMVAGNLKVTYAEYDKKIELAIPTTIVGESFTVGGIAEASRITVPFIMDDSTFWVELIFVENE